MEEPLYWEITNLETYTYWEMVHTNLRYRFDKKKTTTKNRMRVPRSFLLKLTDGELYTYIYRRFLKETTWTVTACLSIRGIHTLDHILSNFI